jgi:hypothetical protein
MFCPTAVYGVDFSGARLAGRHTWLARIERAGEDHATAPYRLTQLAPLGKLAKTDERGPALAHLVGRIAASEGALWAMDFPFGFPVEVMPPGAGWLAQLAFVRGWAPEECWAAGVACLDRAKALGREGHIRRLTDRENRCPFDSYHYRIIYQTFFGMRDVLAPLLLGPAACGTAVLPFRYTALPGARRVVVEACPASTLKHLGLPHQNYKQPGGGPPDARRRAVRRVILAGLAPHVRVGRARRKLLMDDGGGDALDALIAAVGAALSWRETDHRAVMRHPLYVREGRQFV